MDQEDTTGANLLHRSLNNWAFKLDEMDAQKYEYNEENHQFDNVMQITFSSVFVALFLMMICVSLCGKRIRPIPTDGHEHNETPQSTAERRELRRLEREQRMNYIKNSLVVKHVIQEQAIRDVGEADTQVTSTGTSHGELDDIENQETTGSGDSFEKQRRQKSGYRRLKSNLILSDAEDMESTKDSRREPWICAICLTPYEIGDEICWSPNPNCNHVFHHECIEHWLYKHEDCPMCRAIYIYGDEEQGEVVDAHHGCSVDEHAASPPVTALSIPEEGEVTPTNRDVENQVPTALEEGGSTHVDISNQGIQ